MSKFKETRGFPGGVNAKEKWKIPGGHDKIDWKSRGVNFKKIDILNVGGTILFCKSSIEGKKLALMYSFMHQL